MRAWMKYWLMVVSSAVRIWLRSSITLASPFIVQPRCVAGLRGDAVGGAHGGRGGAQARDGSTAAAAIGAGAAARAHVLDGGGAAEDDIGDHAVGNAAAQADDHRGGPLGLKLKMIIIFDFARRSSRSPGEPRCVRPSQRSF